MILYIFFFKQKTAYDMRISDWSSDVCSSDLAHSLAIPSLLQDNDMIALVPSPLATEFASSGALIARAAPYETPHSVVRAIWHQRNTHDPAHAWLRSQIDRKSVVEGKSV